MAVTEQVLEDITGRLVAALHPEKVILFGSRAWGQPHSDSDVDLLIILSDSREPPHHRARRAHAALRGLPIPCDILVRTRDEIDAASRARSSIFARILSQGRTLHG